MIYTLFSGTSEKIIIANRFMKKRSHLLFYPSDVCFRKMLSLSKIVFLCMILRQQPADLTMNNR